MCAATFMPEPLAAPAPAVPLVEVRDLVKHYSAGTGFGAKSKAVVHALDGVSLALLPGETLGLVGESGCGKSTLARQILRLEEPTSGQVLFEGRDLLSLDKAQLKAMRREMQVVFQDPYSSLNPRHTVGQIVAEPLIIHGLGNRREREERVDETLAEVGLRPEAKLRFPHEFSGGQRQRIGIARALILRPKLIIADEPISALDVSIQAQVLNLLKELQDKRGLTYLFIAHDLSVVRYLSDRIAVMYLGRIMESNAVKNFAHPPLHPYTEALLSAAPVANPEAKPQRIVLAGDVPSPLAPPPGCRFHTRCHRIMGDICKEQEPELREIEPGHFAACHLLK